MPTFGFWRTNDAGNHHRRAEGLLVDPEQAWRLAAKYRRTSVVKRRAYLTYRSLINSGKLKPPTKWPVHVTAIIHPLTHGRFDPENAAPMVKAILDAITQADFWPDDNARYVVGPDYRLGEPSTEKGVYHITIRIEEEEH